MCWFVVLQIQAPTILIDQHQKIQLLQAVHFPKIEYPGPPNISQLSVRAVKPTKRDIRIQRHHNPAAYNAGFFDSRFSLRLLHQCSRRIEHTV